MRPEVDSLAAAYLEATGGDPSKALEAAISDLLDIQTEAAFRTAALDQWVSYGYVQGRAHKVLDRVLQRQARGDSA